MGPPAYEYHTMIYYDRVVQTTWVLCIIDIMQANVLRGVSRSTTNRSRTVIGLPIQTYNAAFIMPDKMDDGWMDDHASKIIIMIVIMIITMMILLLLFPFPPVLCISDFFLNTSPSHLFSIIFPNSDYPSIDIQIHTLIIPSRCGTAHISPTPHRSFVFSTDRLSFLHSNSPSFQNPSAKHMTDS